MGRARGRVRGRVRVRVRVRVRHLVHGQHTQPGAREHALVAPRHVARRRVPPFAPPRRLGRRRALRASAAGAAKAGLVPSAAVGRLAVRGLGLGVGVGVRVRLRVVRGRVRGRGRGRVRVRVRLGVGVGVGVGRAWPSGMWKTSGSSGKRACSRPSSLVRVRVKG